MTHPTTREPPSLTVNIAVPIGLAAIGNGVIALFGWRPDDTLSPSFAPPGMVIGAVWILLFAAMGAARWLVLRTDTGHRRRNSILVAVLMLACFAYPYYTLGFRRTLIGLIGSLATAAFSAFVAWRIAADSRLAAALVCTTAVWCMFASAILLRTIQLNS